MALLTPGGPEDFPQLVAQVAAGNGSQGSSGTARALWAIRWKLGELLGWDGPDAGLGSRVPTLRSRLPADLRDGPSGPSCNVLVRNWDAQRTMRRFQSLTALIDATMAVWEGYRST